MPTPPSSSSTPFTSRHRVAGAPSGGGLFNLTCSCKNAKAVSISPSPSSSSASAAATSSPSVSDHHHPRPKSHSLTLTSSTTTSSSSTPHHGHLPPAESPRPSSTSTPTFSGLLRQLSELEHNVLTLHPNDNNDQEEPSPFPTRRGPKLHRRCASEGGATREEGRRKVRESVAVVKETEDPVGDFRRSMVAMIVEKEMATGDELRELLGRFLALNSPENHHLVLKAFAQVWEDEFSPPGLLLVKKVAAGRGGNRCG